MLSFRKKVFISAFAITLIVALSVYAAFPSVQEKVSSLFDSVKSFTQTIASDPNALSNLKEEIFSAPLRSEGGDANAQLDAGGVVELTNAERSTEGLPTLMFNTALTKAAQTKLDDMFTKQYFEHISPDGHGPGYLSEKAGYDYVIVGENLALGNFKDDATLVAAWMASPGHRANILNEKFTEIGVAVGRGTFEGRKVWLAVQEFGKPLSDCPRTDPTLRSDVDVLRSKANTMSADLVARRKALDSMSHRTPEEYTVYNAKVAEYNNEVAEYDRVVRELSGKIDAYNSQVRVFNACIK
jgi:uncharacterized protein YkwD